MLTATAAAGRLNPPAPGGAELLRPRLQEALTAGVAAAPLTVVTGPTGSGKTVLAAAWAKADSRHRVAWLSVCPVAAASPSGFWAGVVTSLRRAGMPLRTLGAPSRGHQLTPGFTVRLAAQLDEATRATVLVVDQADALTRRDILEQLDLLAGHVRPRLRLVLLARSEPLLPLRRERAAGRLAEIRTDDLAFHSGEVGALLARLGTPVPPRDAATLATATEGWAVALPLVAALLQRGVPAGQLAAAMADDEGSPVQYLVGQVLARLPGSVRTVLLRAGVADELWPGLVVTLTGRRDGIRMLDWLAAGNMCVERAPGAPGGLRIPHVVRELLTAGLALADPEESAAAHRAAADWYAAAERLPDAVSHAVAGSDWASAARLLVDDLAVAALLARRGPPEAALVDAAQPGPPGADAALLRAAATLGHTGRASPADLALALAIAADGDSTERPARRASATLLAAAAMADGAHPDRALAAIETAQADAESVVTARPERRAECAAVLATARVSALLATDADDAMLSEAARAADAACAAADADRLRAGRLADLALLQALAGRLRQADALVADHEAACEDYDIPRAARSPAAATAAAWVCTERGQIAGARRWVARAAEGGGHPRAAYTAPLLAVLTCRRLRLRGQLDAAEHALGAVPDGNRPPRWVHEHLLAEHGRLRLARGDPEASGLLGVLPGSGAVPETVGSGVTPIVALEAQLVRAGLLAAAGNSAAAAALISEALRAAEPDKLRRPFLDAPPRVQQVLRVHPGLVAARGWVFTPQESRPARPATRDRRDTAPGLSAREREALSLLAAGLSTAGIAAAMRISTNTARGHLRGILRKLSATDRADAVRRATQLGLL